MPEGAAPGRLHFPMIARLAAPLALLWALGILVLTLMPSSGVPRWPWAAQVHLDKFIHAFLFGMQCVLLGMAFARSGSQWLAARPFLLAFLLALAYGALIEVLQESMDIGRRGDLGDLLADGAGALLGYALLRWRKRARA